MSALRSGTCSLTHPGWRPTSEGSSLRPALAASTRTPASKSSASCSRRRAASTSRPTSRRPCSRRSGCSAPRSKDPPRQAPRAPRPTWPASRPSSSHPPSSLQPRSTARPACSSPASTVSSRASAVSHPTIGGSGSSCATASIRIGPRRPARRARSVTSAARAHSCGSTQTREVACVYLGDADFGPWAASAWPAFSATVLEAGGGLTGSPSRNTTY